MKVSRVLVLCAAIGLIGAAAASAQGRGATQRPPKVATHAPKDAAQGAKTAPQGPKATGTAGKSADRGKPADAAASARGQERSIAANIAKSPQLEARLKAMLPSGMTMEQASEGFRNQGQFIAALEASKNQNIEFAKLKAEMTGENALSLGQAIQKLKPAETTTTTAANP
jgi:hypothetical protein